MRLKNKVNILLEDSTFQEVQGETFPYEYNGHKFQLIVHDSVQPWTPNVMDISEATTGCRCISTGKPVASSTKADIVEVMNNFIKGRGLRNVQAQIKKRLEQIKNLTS